jgi:hypothetical protein
LALRVGLGYNSFGPETLGDQCHHNPGGKEPLLDDVQQALLWQALQEPASDGRQWNGRKVADWIAELIGRPVGRQRGWEYFKQMRLRLEYLVQFMKKPLPKEQAEWKKSGDSSGEDSTSSSRLRRGTMGNG